MNNTSRDNNKSMNNSKTNFKGNNLNQLNISQNTINSKNRVNSEYNDMDINRIREFIQILEEHQIKSEKEKKFVDAEIAKQKVAQLKIVEKEKIMSDLKNNHQEEVQSFEVEKNNTFIEFNKQWDKNYQELMEKFIEFEQKLKLQQQNDLNERILEFDKKYYPVIKPTSEVLNLTKILNGLIRQKEYIKAHQIQNQINVLQNFDNSQFVQEKERKLAKEVDKIKAKHYQEYQVLVAKKELAEAEYSKNRQIEYDKMVQMFKNKIKEIDIHQSYEITQILNPRKYLARNLNRSQGYTQSRIHSSASVDKVRTDKNLNK